MSSYAHLREFLDVGEREMLGSAITGHPELFRARDGARGWGPNYRVVDGARIREHLPEVVRFGEERVRPVVEEFAGCKLQPYQSGPRSIRIQSYEGRAQGFRWHYDGSLFSALIALTNDNGGETHLVSPRLSRARLLVRSGRNRSAQPVEELARGQAELLSSGRAPPIVDCSSRLGVPGRSHVDVVLAAGAADDRPNEAAYRILHHSVYRRRSVLDGAGPSRTQRTYSPTEGVDGIQ